MISTQYQAEHNVVINRLIDELDERQLENAANHTQALCEQHDAAVIWDLGDVSYFQPLEELNRHMKQELSARFTKMNGTKRAFVASMEQRRRLVGELMDGAKTPWSWGLFDSLEEAVQWIAKR